MVKNIGFIAAHENSIRRPSLGSFLSKIRIRSRALDCLRNALRCNGDFQYSIALIGEEFVCFLDLIEFEPMCHHWLQVDTT